MVDWNPSGANILSVYKHGSSRVGPESLTCGCHNPNVSIQPVCQRKQRRPKRCRLRLWRRVVNGVEYMSIEQRGHFAKWSGEGRYAAGDMRWLGITAAMLEGVPPDTFRPLTPRDRALVDSLCRGYAKHLQLL